MLLAGMCWAAPIISHEELTGLSDNTVQITWVTSNETATTIVKYGIGFPTQTYSSSTPVNYHSAILTNLSPGTTYQYYVQSGDIMGMQKSFTTLTPPSGNLLFSFAAVSDPQYGDGKKNTTGARGRPYENSVQIMDNLVTMINAFLPSFTILKGDLIESSVKAGDLYSPYGDDIFNVEGAAKYAGQESVRTKLNRLTSAADASAKYYPIPGNHDKTASAYTLGNASSWYNDNLNRLYALAVADPTVGSSYNYVINYQGYRFIFLDSVTAEAADIKAYINTGYLSTQLAQARTDKVKCFIFTHHPVTNVQEEGLPDQVIEEVTGGTVDYTKIMPSNWAAVQTLITNYKDVIAGVFSGHIHDTTYKEVAGVPCVRNAGGIQYPTVFNIYKVYQDGYIQSTYKLPYYTELARNTITPEAGYSQEYWTGALLGALSARNFTHTLSYAPPFVSQTSPSIASANVPLNADIKIIFTKPMSTADTQNAIVSIPALTGASYSWDISGQTLTISHGNLSPSQLYTVTIGTGAKDISGEALTAYAFTFTTGTSTDTTPPVAAFDHIANDVSSDTQPTLTGITTDELSSIVSVECRVDGGAWQAAHSLNVQFTAKTENYSFRPASTLTRGLTLHRFEVRSRDSAGNWSAVSAYNIYVVGDRPDVNVLANGADIISGDPISKSPSFEIQALTDKSLKVLDFVLDNTTTTNLLTATVETGSAALYKAYYRPNLADGTHNVKVTAVDSENHISTFEATNLIVQSADEVKIQGVPLNYPNPFNPETGTNIGYILSKAGNIQITIHDLMGNQIAKLEYSTGQNGGRAGYNEVAWNGKSASGALAGNGIYIYLIISDGRVLARGKLAAIK